MRKVMYRILMGAESDGYPFHVSLKEEEKKSFFARKTVSWVWLGSRKTLEEAEKLIKDRSIPPIYYDAKGNRI